MLADTSTWRGKPAAFRHSSMNVSTGEDPGWRSLRNLSNNRSRSLIDQAPRGVLIQRPKSWHIETWIMHGALRGVARLMGEPIWKS
jgi:hypothetical protein